MEIGNLKKSFFAFLSMMLVASYLLPGIANAKESVEMKVDFVETEEVSNYVEQLEEYSFVDDLDIFKVASELNLTEQDLIDLDNQLMNPEIETYGVGIGLFLVS